MKSKKFTMVGRYFHSVTKDTKQIQWQGWILGQPSKGVYMCQLVEWMMGQTSAQVLVKFEDMQDWLFYDTQDDMIYSYDYGTAREGGPYRKKIIVEPKSVDIDKVTSTIKAV